MTNLRPDILISNQDGTPIAAVEIKNRQHLTPEVATVLRRNLAVHGYAPSVPYYLLLSQDVGYLWKNTQPHGIDAPPDYQFPMGNVISRYLKSEAHPRLSGAELELVVVQWLITLTLEPAEPHEEPENSLVTAGFLNAIQGASVVAEAAV